MENENNIEGASVNAANAGNAGSAVPEPPEMPQDDMKARIDRLGGEQAPDISPEEFARLQRSGALHIDAHGRVRANRREESDPGVSLRKRRAWYG